MHIKSLINKANKYNFKDYSDEDLKEKFFALKGNTSLFSEQIAVSKEIIKRTTNLDLFDVQLIGAVYLLRGNIVEMKTGEGKTIVAILTSLLRFLEGGKTHIVTVNDYLAKRDGLYASQVYDFLGLNAQYIVSEEKAVNRKKKYDEADVLYITNSELGFDYLRSNGAYYKEDVIFNIKNALVIVDEADSILIDEAKIPLILSATKEVQPVLYKHVNSFVLDVKKDKSLYEIEKKDRQVFLTEEGCRLAEKRFRLTNSYSSEEYVDLRHLIEQSLVAHLIMQKDKDYIVKNGEVILIDQSTGRIAIGRRFNRGLHQAIEAKEGVIIKEEAATVATITYQNLFKMYEKLSGMTGTAKTEKKEFKEIYKLDVKCVPTNKPVIRKDQKDLLFASFSDRDKYLLRMVEENHSKGRPILIGTSSIEQSEYIAKILKQNNYRAQVLNAKNHELEADIVAKAGYKNAITVATNMAGRGTDIKLEDGVKELGGLLLIGIGHYENIRIDNQLRGRSGRQGDPGESIFLVSMDDELINTFASETLKNLIKSLNKDNNGEPITHRAFSKAIKNAQYQIQVKTFNQRKATIEYDEILGKYRDLYYKERMYILGEKTAENIVKELFNLESDNINIKKAIGEDIKRRILMIMDSGWMHLLEASEDLRYDSSYLSYTGTKPITIYEQQMANYYEKFLTETKEKIKKLFTID